MLTIRQNQLMVLCMISMLSLPELIIVIQITVFSLVQLLHSCVNMVLLHEGINRSNYSTIVLIETSH